LLITKVCDAVEFANFNPKNLVLILGRILFARPVAVNVPLENSVAPSLISSSNVSASLPEYKYQVTASLSLNVPEDAPPANSIVREFNLLHPSGSSESCTRGHKT
jgi:hypothetical protein